MREGKWESHTPVRKLSKMVFTDCGRAYLAGYVASNAPVGLSFVSGISYFAACFHLRTNFSQACGVESEGYVYTMKKAALAKEN